MPNNNIVIRRLLNKAPPDPTVIATLDFAINVLNAISGAVPANATQIRAIQHYLNQATFTLETCKNQHSKITQ